MSSAATAPDPTRNAVDLDRLHDLMLDQFAGFDEVEMTLVHPQPRAPEVARGRFGYEPYFGAYAKLAGEDAERRAFTAWVIDPKTGWSSFGEPTIVPVAATYDADARLLSIVDGANGEAVHLRGI
jgi:hypothetical protein